MGPIFKRGLLSGLKFISALSRRSYSDMAKLVETERVGKVVLIGINRPEKRNCVNLATAEELVKAFTDFENDDSLNVAILHGKGGTFCAGYDLSELSKVDMENATESGLLKNGYVGMGPARMQWKKPVIAAVAGYAVAGGLELALMCDMRVAEESAVFGVFCRRFGVPLTDGGTVRLPGLIGMSRAMDLILTGRPVQAQEAYDMGLVNRIAPNGTGLGVAMQLAHRLCNFPQACLRQDKQSAYHAAFEAESFQAAVDHELSTGLEVIAKESIRGAGKFVSGVGKGGSFDAFDPEAKPDSKL